MAELAINHDLWVLSDEAYLEIKYADKAESISRLPGMQERTVILYTYSKRYALTGWHLGAAIGPQAVIDVFNNLNTNIESCMTHFIQRGMVDAIAGNTSGPNAIIEELRRRRDTAVAGLNAIDGISIQVPDSTLYLFPNVSDIMKRKGFTDVNQLMEETLTVTNVSVCTRKRFGRAGEHESDH